MSKSHLNLSKRERQIMNIIYEHQEATALEVQDIMSDPPSYSAIRTHLRILEEKGFLSHTKRGNQYLFRPVISPKKAMKDALSQVMQTFFNNSVEETVAAVLQTKHGNLSSDQYDQLQKMIQKARNDEK